MRPDRDRIARRGEKWFTRHVLPIEGEPAYGFMMRLVAAHREPSALAFGAALDVNMAHVDLEGSLVAVCASPLASDDDKTRLRRWTPIVASPLTNVAGQSVRRGDFSLRTRRFCPGCLAESAYHRVWFDLLFMDRCPFHGAAIGSRLEGEEGSANWSWSTLDALPSGVKLARPMARLPMLAETLEGYTLRRLGLAPAREDPFLDAYHLSDVVEAAELVGRLVVGGRRETMPLIGSPGFEAPVLREEGWKVLGQGRDALKALYGAIAAKAPEELFGVRHLFGWCQFNMPFKGELARALMDVQKEVAQELGRHGRRYHGDAAGGTATQSELLTIREVSSMLGETENGVDAIGRAFDLFEPHVGRKGSPLLLARGKVEAVRKAFASALTRTQAAERLRLPVHMFNEVVIAGLIEKHAVRWDARDRTEARRLTNKATRDDPDRVRLGGFSEDRFAIDELDRFLRRIPLKDASLSPRARTGETCVSPHLMSVPRMLEHTGIDAGEFFRDVLGGVLVVFGRAAYRNGLEDFYMRLCDQPLDNGFTQRWLSTVRSRDPKPVEGAMSQREACIALDLNPRTIKTLCDLGHIGLVASKFCKDHFRLDRKSVEAFATEWAATKIYAKALGCQDAKVHALARERGVSDFFALNHPDVDLGRLNGIVGRAAMRSAFGLLGEPEDTDPARRAWRKAAAWLGARKSMFKVWTIRPGVSTLISTSDYEWPIRIDYVFGDEAIPEGPLRFDVIGRRFYAVDASLELGGKAAEARMQHFADRIEKGLPQGLLASVDRKEGIVRASMRAQFLVDHEDLGTEALLERYIERDLPVIMEMAYLIKCTFEVGIRPFDRKVFWPWPSCFEALTDAADRKAEAAFEKVLLGGHIGGAQLVAGSVD